MIHIVISKKIGIKYSITNNPSVLTNSSELIFVRFLMNEFNSMTPF